MNKIKGSENVGVRLGGIYEVGISYYGRTFEDGKKIRMKDGFRALYCILKYGVFRRRIKYYKNRGQLINSAAKTNEINR
jgi:hypothetical protein